MATDDFRSFRLLLPDDAFAIVVPASQPETLDPIDRPTWSGLVGLPDDVLLRTTSRHGASLKRSYEAWGHWAGLVSDVQGLTSGEIAQDPLAVSILDATDEFQASIYIAMTGFYRQSIGILRSVLESTLAALYFKRIPSTETELKSWLDGREEGRLQLRRLRDALSNIEPIRRFERGTNRLFGRDGWYGWLYRILSAYVHGRPSHVEPGGRALATTNGAMWESNGPIYEGRAYEFWEVMFFNTMLLALLLVGLADERLATLARPQDLSYERFLEKLMEWHPAPGAPVVAATVARHLCPR